MQQADTKKIAARIQYLREIFNLSYADVAAVVGMTPEEYQNAEAGKVDFPFSFMQKLAKYYAVDLVEIITGAAPKLKGFEVVRAGEGMPYERRKGFHYAHLAPRFKDKVTEPFVVQAKFSAEEQAQPIPLSTHNDEEFNYILEGRMRFRINDYETVLEAGDSVYYNADLPHGMIALEGGCKFLAIVIGKGGAPDVATPPEVSADPIAARDKTALYRKFITPVTDEAGKLLALDYHPPENFNFAYDVVDALAEKNPGKPAMIWVSEQKEPTIFTFGDMKRLSDKCANFLLAQGVKKGDKVMVVLKRYHQFWPTIVALHKIGAIAVPATHLLTKKDFEYRFNAAGISAVVMTSDGTASAECELALPGSPTMKTLIIVGESRKGWIDYDAGVAQASEEFARVETHINDVMIMYFTSGTTGYPKIATHAYSYPLGHFSTAKYWHNVDPDGIHFTISDTGWAKSVWGKLYGQWLCEAAIFTYNFERFHAAEILEMFAKYNITTFCAPPTMYRFFIKEDLASFDLSSLKHATIAGEALNPEVFEQFYKATGLKLMEGFGQTETTLTIFNMPGTEPKPGSMGKPFSPQYDIDLVDSDGNSVKPGEVGEIVIRTNKRVPYGMFLGYYRNEEGTNAAWNHDIYHTGDVAWQDEDGYIWYVGRVDDVIKSSGYRIGPFEVESVIMELPYVLECAVTGIPDEVRGQLVKATVVLTKGTVPTEALKKDIQTYVKEHTAPYKYPRIVEFRETLPKTISGKIMRKDLR